MNVAYNNTTYYKLQIRKGLGIITKIYHTVEELENELKVINIGKGIPNENNH